jgi:anhydro-N-acetylmuramic acid kinase
MDGIDVAVLDTDGEARLRIGPGQTYPYPDDVRRELGAVIADPAQAEHAPLIELERAVTGAHCDAVLAFMADHGVERQTVDLVGMHGQTVFHRPERRITRQLLDGGMAAAGLGIDVVFRFRHADVAAGGKGAPFVPLYHRALVASHPQPVLILNLGGVANLTYIDGETVIAFDTGPASALLDDFVRSRTGRAYDANGALAASGMADAALIAAFMDNPFFALPPPKALDRNDFHRRAATVAALGDEDGAATLTAFTVESIAAARAHLPKPPLRWLVAGGGRLNSHMMSSLRERLQCPVDPIESVGLNGDFTEAECFAYLGVRSRRALPLSLPSTTGVPAPMTGGELAQAPQAL